MKRDGRKDTSSDLNAITEKAINVLKTSAIDGNKKENSTIDIPNTKSGKKRSKEPKIKKEVLLSKPQVQSSCLFGSSSCQKRKLQRLSAQELKEKGMAWIPKGSAQTPDKDNVHIRGVAQLKEKRWSKIRSLKMRFSPNHRHYWLVHHPFDLQIPCMPMSWNSSLNAFGYPSYSYFDPQMPYGSLYHGGLSPNCYAY